MHQSAQPFCRASLWIDAFSGAMSWSFWGGSAHLCWRLAGRVCPLALRGPDISIAPEVLPYYAVLSVAGWPRHASSLLVALFYGRAAAEHRQAEQVLMPLLDVLQSVPILSFLPVVLLSLSAVLPPPRSRACGHCAHFYQSGLEPHFLPGISPSKDHSL